MTPFFWMGQCWVEASFTLLKVLLEQVGAEAEPRCCTQSCHLGQVPALSGFQGAFELS